MDSGVYEILNNTNGKRYVGSAKRFGPRWNTHRTHLRRGSHHSRHLQSAWNKYGESSFSFNKIVICKPQDLLCYEQLAIDATQPEYNVARIAGNTLGTKRTPETRAILSQKAMGRNWSQESRDKLSATLTGRRMPEEFRARLLGNKRAAGTKHSPDRRAAISQFMTGQSRPKSPEHRAKIAAALKGRKATMESRAKQSAAQLGKKRGPYKPRSAETRSRAAALRATKPNPVFGRKHSLESRKRISDALRGHPVSQEKRKQASIVLKAMWADPERRVNIIRRQKEARIARGCSK